jgi:hypothetical protein
VSTQPELEITPEPTAEERAAIEAAVAELLDDGQGDEAPPGAWWRAGIEATEETDDS